MISQAERAADPPIFSMHPDTLAAFRLLVLALEAHPEDIELLAEYGNLPEHLADIIDDYIDDDD